MNGRKVGIYVDVENITMNGGRGMQYDVLRSFACRGHGDAMRMNAYVRFDEDRAREHDPTYAKVLEFHSRLRDSGFKVVEKPIRWYRDAGTGERYGKANSDLDMAVDMLLQSERLDRVVVASGDNDFARVVSALQNQGKRVEVIAFRNVDPLLESQADLYMSGYLIPNLLPLAHEGGEAPEWGQEGSRVRGTCYWYEPEKKFGFLRYLKEVNDHLWMLDSRLPGSPFATSFFHLSALEDETLARRMPNRELILEFTLRVGEKGWVAEDIVHINP